MSDDKNIENVEIDVDSSYQPPPEKTIEQILATDEEDESLRKYKQALLGEAQTGTVIYGEHPSVLIDIE